MNPDMVLSRENGTLVVSRPSDERMYRQLHGLTRTLIANMVQGVTAGYRKDLEIQGVGYRAAMDGQTLVLSVGYSHTVRRDPPEGITFVLDSPDAHRRNRDRQAVGRRAGGAIAPGSPARTLQGQGHPLSR